MSASTSTPTASSRSATPSEAAPAATAPAVIAKAALRRLAMSRQEPTPENFARAYAMEGGEQASVVPAPAVGAAPAGATSPSDPSPGASGEALAELIERIVRGVDQGGKQWTRARKRDSLQRVLKGSRADADRLQNRLSQLVLSWQDDRPDVAADDGMASAEDSPRAADEGAPAAPTQNQDTQGWLRIADALAHSVCGALPRPGGLAGEAVASIATQVPVDQLAERIAAQTGTLHRLGADPRAVIELEELCQQADRVLSHRERLLEQMNKLCHELTDSLVVLSEDDSWAQGQCEAMRQVLEQGLSTRGVRSVSDLLRLTRERQQSLRHEREQARDALKTMIQRMLGEIGELGSATGRFHESVDRYAGVIERAESLESLAGVVREMVEESRTVAGVVGQTRQRLLDEQGRAEQLANKVDHLEAELRRLSEEVSTDQLTQVANRRGLIAQFNQELARRQREGGTLSIGLLDIDNFKRLNDTLGHAAGDQALKALAQAVKQALRPTDGVARFGGEEFVVVLPATPLSEAQQILTRLQRSLSGSLFMHENQPVFVTFSAGVTEYRDGETLEAALERADMGLYEAKRTGKNRTCVA